MIRIYLLRHGKTKGNVDKKYIGSTDEPLCEIGILEAQNVMISNIQKIIVSPMKRCIMTAEIVFPNMDFKICKDLRECDFGDFENKTYEMLKDNEAYVKWISSKVMTAIPGGEPTEDFKIRCQKTFLEEVYKLEKDGYDSCAFVVHGGTIMSIMEGFFEEHNDFYFWQVENCHGVVTEAYFEDERMVLRNGKKF